MFIWFSFLPNEENVSSTPFWVVGGNHEFGCSSNNYFCGDTAYIVLDFNKKDTFHRNDTFHHAVGLIIPFPNDRNQIYIERVSPDPMGELNIRVHATFNDCDKALDSSTIVDSRPLESGYVMDWRREDVTFFVSYKPDVNERCTLKVTRSVPLKEAEFTIPNHRQPITAWTRGLQGIKYRIQQTGLIGRSWTYQLTTEDTSIIHGTNTFVQLLDTLPQIASYKVISTLGVDSFICSSESKEIPLELNDVEFSRRKSIRGKISMKNGGCNQVNAIPISHQQVHLTNGSDHFYTHTNDNGEYEISLPYGVYLISLHGLDTLRGIQPCRGGNVITVQKNHKSTFETFYVNDNTCSHLQLESFPYTYSYLDDEEIDISFEIVNISSNPMMDVEIPFAIQSSAKILSVHSSNIRQTGLNRGIVEMATLNPGESSLIKMRIEPARRISTFKGKVGIDFYINNINHCYRSDTLRRFIQWHELSADLNVFTTPGSLSSTKDLTVENFKTVDKSQDMEHSIQIRSNHSIDPYSVRLLNNGVGCSQLELSDGLKEMWVIEECSDLPDKYNVMAFKFHALEPTQNFEWSLDYKMKVGYYHQYDLSNVNYTIEEDSSYRVTPSAFWRDAPILCDPEVVANFNLQNNTNSESQRIIDHNGDELSLQNAFWFAIPGTGDPIDLTININDSRCHVRSGVLAGHPEKWRWVSRFTHFNSEKTFKFDSEKNKLYYWILDFRDGTWCGNPIITSKPSEKFNDVFPDSIEITKIYGSSYPGSVLEICTNIDPDYMPKVEFITSDTIIKGLNTHGCVEYLVKGPGSIDYTIVSKFGGNTHVCGDSVMGSFSLLSLERENFVNLTGTIFNARDTICNVDTLEFENKCFEIELEGTDNHRFKTDSSGRYNVILLPGEYNVVIKDEEEDMDLCALSQKITIEGDTILRLGITSANHCPNFNIRPRPGGHSDVLPGDTLIKEFNWFGNSIFPSEMIIEVMASRDIQLDSVSLPYKQITDSTYHVRILTEKTPKNVNIRVYFHMKPSFELSRNQLKLTGIFPECNFSSAIATFYSADTSSCQSARRVCESSFVDSLQFTSQGYPLYELCPDDIDYPGTPHNVIWYEFYTEDTTGTIQITTSPSECFLGFGIQAGIYEGTCSRSHIVDCHSECSDTILLNGSFSAKQKYYLWVDGCDRDLCSFEVYVDFPLVCEKIFRSRSINHVQTDLCGERIISLFPPVNRIREAELKWVIGNDTFYEENPVVNIQNGDTIGVRLMGSWQLGTVSLRDTIFDTIILDTTVHSGYLRGSVYLNQSCDSNMLKSLVNVPLKFVSSNFEYHTFSDSMGQFELCVQASEYYLDEIALKSIGLLNCDSLGINVKDRDTTDWDIILTADSCGSLKTFVHGLRRFRCNAPSNVAYVTIQNLSDVFARPPSLFLDVDTFLRIDNVAGNLVDSFIFRSSSVVEILLNDIPANSRSSIAVKVLPNCDNDDIGKPFCLRSYYEPNFNECLRDTVTHFCVVLRNSFDPNDLQVFPKGETDENYIDNFEELEFLIRYQNMGTDTAFDIRVEHQFSDEFIPSSFRLIESSFTGLQAIVHSGPDEKLIEFLLPEVLLPDDKTNEEGSHGFIRFKLVMEELPKLYKHSSYADIYFDYNPPIRTNTVYHTITTDYFYGNRSIDICEKDQFLGLTLFNDTTVYDTLIIPGPDSIYEYVVNVEGVKVENIDTLVCPGDVIEYEGDLLFAEGTYKYSKTSNSGCDDCTLLNLKHKVHVEYQIDTLLSLGSTFMGNIVSKDTLYYEFRESSDSCIDVFYHVKLLTSVNQNFSKGSLINIYPNPSADYIMVNSLRGSKFIIEELRIVDIFGQEVLFEKSVLLPNKISIDQLATGIYVLQVTDILGAKDVIIFNKI